MNSSVQNPAAKANSASNTPKILRMFKLWIQRITTGLKLDNSLLPAAMDQFLDEHLKFSPSDRLQNGIFLAEMQRFLKICHELAKKNFNESYFHRMTMLLRIWLKFKVCGIKPEPEIEDVDMLCKEIDVYVQYHLSGSVRKNIIDLLLVIPKMFKSKPTFHSTTGTIKVCKVIFNRYLGQMQATSQEMDDEDFVKHMLCYRFWRNMETDNKLKCKIKKLFVNNVRPRCTLVSNPKLAPMLPFYDPSVPGAYVTLIEKNYSTKKLHQELEKPFMESPQKEFMSPICCIHIDGSSDENKNPSIAIDLCYNSPDSSSSVETVIWPRTETPVDRSSTPYFSKNQTPERLPITNSSVSKNDRNSSRGCRRLSFKKSPDSGQIRRPCPKAGPPSRPGVLSPARPPSSEALLHVKQNASEVSKRWKRGGSLRPVR